MNNNKISTEKPEANKQPSRRRMRIGISFAVIVTALILIFMPKKIAQDTTSTPLAPMFKKQGALTISTRDDKPIISLSIEIADDENKREVGLMGRPVLGEREGMLFIFEEEHMASFWMKNTILPLDILFIDKLGIIVTICKNTKPFSEESYSATAPTLLVLEVNAGFTDKYGIKEGDRISWKRD
jgi:uncharacterized membrane protein (UPF0127 family)